MGVEEPPTGELEFKPIVWEAGRDMYRVHEDQWPSNSFNPTKKKARFRPFSTATHDPVPTMYVSDLREGALGESVFHDLRGGDQLSGAKLSNQVRTHLIPQRALVLVDLTGWGTKRIKQNNRQMVQCDPDEYPVTALWGKKLHGSKAAGTGQLPDGIYWRSRQFDDAMAAILFGDRVSPDDLVVDPTDTVDLWHGPGLAEVYAAAEEIDITVSFP